MELKNFTVFGGGVLGSQVAWQAAMHGIKTTVYDINNEAIEVCKNKHQVYATQFKSQFNIDEEKINSALSLITYTTDLAEAVADADITSESIPENLELKQKFYEDLAPLLPKKTILTTNSSTLLPSMLAPYTGRPEKFLALHFANPVWSANIGEVMRHKETDNQVFDAVVEFARKMGLVPIPIYKEQPGYVLNTLLIPLLEAAQTLYFNGVADYRSIDKTWMISTGAKVGPFGIIDLVGMNTVYNIIMLRYKQTGNKELLERAQKIKQQFIDKGKLGVAAGEGFYKYPNPDYQKPDFLK